jgi:energy-coupling factor transport system permease protein
MVIASMVYAALDTPVTALLKAWLAVALLAACSALWLPVMGLAFQAIRDAPSSMAVNPFLRLGAMVNVVIPLAMNSGVSELLAALGRPWIPPLLKLPLMVAIRFVPTIINDLRQLKEAVLIRFQGRCGPIFWFSHPLIWWRVLIAPLIVRLIRSADDLAVAAELKGLRSDIDLGEPQRGLNHSDKAALIAAALTIIAAGALEAVNRGL